MKQQQQLFTVLERSKNNSQHCNNNYALCALSKENEIYGCGVFNRAHKREIFVVD
jgi:hypothetical protein